MTESQRLVPADKPGVVRDASPRFKSSDYTIVTAGSGTTIEFQVPYDISSISTGDAVVYSAGGGTPYGGLTDGGTYYAIMLGGQNMELAATQDDANAGTPIPITSRAGGARRPAPRRASSSRAASPPATLPTRTRSPRRRSSCPRRRSHGVAMTGDPTATTSRRSASTSAPPSSPPPSACPAPSQLSAATTKATVGAPASRSTSGQSAAGRGIGDEFHQLAVTATLAIGGSAGVAAAASVRVVTLDTEATVGDRDADQRRQRHQRSPPRRPTP